MAYNRLEDENSHDASVMYYAPTHVPELLKKCTLLHILTTFMNPHRSIHVRTVSMDQLCLDDKSGTTSDEKTPCFVTMT
jgi:hypothetical protein